MVSLRYEGGVTASLTMTAFTEMRDRVTRIFGTRGELRGDGDGDRGLRLPHPRDGAARGRRRAGQATAAATTAIMDDFIAAVAAGDPALVPTTPRVALESHRIAFAAETARHEDRVVVFA